MNEQQFRALSEEQRKAIQQRLKDQGLYVGNVDGRWGAGTETALDNEAKNAKEQEAADRASKEKERSDKLEAERLELEREKLKQTGKKTDVEAAEAERKTKAREKRSEDASSILGTTAQTLAGAPSALGGVWAGRKMGEGINYWMDDSQTNKNEKLRNLAADRRAGVTTKAGARTAARLAGIMPPDNSVVRVGGRMLPHMGLAGFMGGKGALLLSQEDPEGPFYPEMANRAAGIGMLGAATGIAERGIMYAGSPGVSPDAQALAIIESDQIRRGGSKGAQGQTTTPRTALVAEAKAAGIPKTSKMNMRQLAEALANVKNTTSKLPSVLAGPAAAGALAYGLTPQPAEAGDGSAPSNDQALTNAALASGGYAGARAAAPKLAETLSGSTLARLAAPVGRVAARAFPPAMAALTAYDTVNTIDDLAHLSPPQDPREFSTMGAFMPGQADPAYAPTQPAPASNGAVPMRAAALQPPQIPPGAGRQEAIAAEFDPAMRGGPQQAGMGLPPDLHQQLQMLVQQGASPDLIASYLNHIAAGV